MKSFVLFCLLCSSALLTAQNLVNLESYATGFSSPIGLESAGDDRLFVVERSGYIRIIDGAGGLPGTPFLDIDARVIFTGGFSEQGLLGLAFHPDYASNGYFFVHYTRLDGDGQISRFSVNAFDADIADPDSELKIMKIGQPFQNHNGGDLKFGPDGFLYIGLGDGGSANDPQGNGQDMQTWLGKMLRIDVNNSSESEPYAIPDDNPYVNDAGVLDEIWASGLRNPWRYSFDRETGDMYIADVGQDAFAEIDFEPAGWTGGSNYGWRCYEGNSPFNTSNCEASDAYDFPVHQYAHGGFGGPCSITGGFVYRGCEYADLYGKYIYGDFCDGSIWALSNDGTDWQNEIANTSGDAWSSFGQDNLGNVYVCNMQSGVVFKITGNEAFASPAILENFPTISVDESTIPPVASYQWFVDGVLEAGATNPTYEIIGGSSFYAELTFADGCVLQTETFFVLETETLDGVSNISIFPNPFSDNFQLKMDSQKRNNFQLELINIQGQKVWEAEWQLAGKGQKEIQANELAAGVYYLKISTGEGTVVRKVTKG